jgi:heptosyltransferase II
MAPVGTIAVFLPNWVGDVVMATPALRALRKHYRDARIVYVGRPASLATVAGTPHADATIPDLSNRPPIWRNFRDLVRQLRGLRADLAVLLPNSFRSAAVARLGGAGRVAGYARDGRGWLLTDKLAPPRDADGRFTPVSAVDYYADLAAALGARPRSRRMSLPVRPEDTAAADAMLAAAGVAGDGPLVMLNPGASFGTSKMWSAGRYAALADMLIERRGARIIVNAAPSERHIAAWVGQAMRHAPAISFADRDNTLGMLKALLRRCDLLVTNDTGARHLAAAMRIGVVTLFGSTDPAWARIDYPRERLVRVPVPCSPCQQKLCAQPAGPAYHQCMEQITPEMVFAAAAELLDAHRPAVAAHEGPGVPA